MSHSRLDPKEKILYYGSTFLLYFPSWMWWAFHNQCKQNKNDIFIISLIHYCLWNERKYKLFLIIQVQFFCWLLMYHSLFVPRKQ